MLRKCVATLAVAAGVSCTLAAPAAAAPTGCYDASRPATVEQARLDDTLPGSDRPVGQALIDRGGLSGLVHAFTAGLCVQTRATAPRFARAMGTALWRTAVARARAGAGDDRPLYWARLAMTRAAHRWTGGADVSRPLDRAARGLTDIRYPAGTKRLLVSGFDPFELDGGNLRRSNPAGAAALRLDGRVFHTRHGKVAVQAVSFPVLWGGNDGFDSGIVEAAYGPALRHQHLDGIVTISQGYPDKFTIERWAADWRGGFPDNDRASSTGPVPPAAGWPQPPRQFIETTLPYRRMIDAASGQYPVRYNLPFCQWPPGSTPGVGEPECHSRGEPTPGAVAEEGGGGNYLSNESFYRANRLRLGLGLRGLPGGHLHTPVLGQPAGTELSDRAFETQRAAIVRETVSMIPAVAGGSP